MAKVSVVFMVLQSRRGDAAAIASSSSRAFAAGASHDVAADEDSAFLVTVARPQLD